MNTDLMFSSKRHDWETPQQLFDNLNSEFKFTLDPCSTHSNAKCKKHYTLTENGLIQDWSNETVFVNPPYGKELSKWIEKCYNENKNNNVTVVMLIPARTDTIAFHKYIYNNAEIRFIKGRLKFTINGEVSNPAPFPSMIVIFKGGEQHE